jgi:4-cresol dehydrogenase (hydroxylating) flavoprotein subunit
VTGVGDALRDWAGVLGPEAVVTGPGLARYAANVTGYERVVPAALRVRDRRQVPEVVAVARRHGVPLYPISTGHNWGLGSRLPVRDGAVVVDLAGMERIVALDRATATVVVEPGVTQGQLSDHLAREAPELVANMTGSAAATSLVGNTVDRGIGYLAPRVDDLVGIEVVLGTGETVRTGEWPTASELGGAHHGPHWRHGVGPSLEALFVQSNLGIVTAAALRLRSRPAATTAFRASVAADGDGAELLDALAVLHRDGVLTMPTRLFDGTWMHGSPDGPDPAWTAFGGLTGRPVVVGALEDEVRRALDPLTTLELASAGVDPGADESSWWRSVLNVMAGRPTDLSVANWAARVGVSFTSEDPDDLDASDFGMTCDVRAVPFAGREAYDVVAAARAAARPHGLRPHVSLSALDAHTLEAVFILLFDRSSPARVAAAHAATVDLRRVLDKSAVVPHRVGIDAAAQVVVPGDPYWETLAGIKRALDPDLVIAPGRYSPL